MNARAWSWRGWPPSFAPAAAILPAVVLGVMGYQRRWLSDDGYIDLQVVRHLLAGHGPVSAVDERVEVYTNPLWVALLTVWGALGGPLEHGAVMLGLALAVGGLLAAQAGAAVLARRLVEDRAPGTVWRCR